MNASASRRTAESSVSRPRHDRGTAFAADAAASQGVGGHSMAQIVEQNCPELLKSAGVVIEQLDAQIGTWQFSLDEGQTWRTIRTDLINRPGCLGLALDHQARLRVLPFGGNRGGARIVFHAVQWSHAQANGSYRPYAMDDDREDSSRSMTLVLSLAAINGEPPAVNVPRPRNKRALVQRAAAHASGTVALDGSMAMA